jgi:hypothetical protein
MSAWRPIGMFNTERIQFAHGNSPHNQRPLSVGELSVEYQEWDAAEVVAVEMRHHYQADAVGVDVGSLHRHQGRGSAIDEYVVRAAQVQASLQTSAAAERVPAP